jgi:hypothetical protein
MIFDIASTCGHMACDTWHEQTMNWDMHINLYACARHNIIKVNKYMRV